MPHAIESAPTGRAKCRACGRAIAKDSLRFGERAPNPFGEGEASFWFHLRCAACKRPEPVHEVLAHSDAALAADEAALLQGLCARGLAHPRLARVHRVEHASSARARCRHCHETIDRGLLRIGLDWWEEGRFSGAGFIHLTCARAYFGTVEDLSLRLSTSMGEGLTAELDAELISALASASSTDGGDASPG